MLESQTVKSKNRQNFSIFLFLLISGIITYLITYNLSKCYDFYLYRHIDSYIPIIFMTFLSKIWKYQYLAVIFIGVSNFTVYKMSDMKYVKNCKLLPSMIYIALIGLLLLILMIDFLQIESNPYGRLI